MSFSLDHRNGLTVCGHRFESLARWQFKIIHSVLGEHSHYTHAPCDRDYNPISRGKLLNYAQCEAVCTEENPAIPNNAHNRAAFEKVITQPKDQNKANKRPRDQGDDTNN